MTKKRHKVQPGIARAFLFLMLILSATQAGGQTLDPLQKPDAKTTLLLGQSLPLKGPSAQLGREYRTGALAWFEEVIHAKFGQTRLHDGPGWTPFTFVLGVGRRRNNRGKGDRGVHLRDQKDER